MKSFIKSTTILMLVITFTKLLHAQSPSRELGLRLGSSQAYNLILKKQKNENTWNRYRLSAGRISINEVSDVFNYNANVSFAFGKEKRESIGNEIYLYHGWEPQIQLVVNGAQKLNRLSITPALNYVLGIMYNLNNKMAIGLETSPSIYLSTEFIYLANDEVSTNVSTGIDFLSNLLNLSLAYRF